MSFWIETKIRYNKVMEDGALKSVTETNIVNALSFTEAEARIIEEVKPYISSEFTVSAVKKTNISEIFYDEREIDGIRLKFFSSRLMKKVVLKNKLQIICWYRLLISIMHLKTLWMA